MIPRTDRSLRSCEPRPAAGIVKGTIKICGGNCSPLLGGRFGMVQLDHVGGLSGKRDLDGD
ncbi:MAG: hypothetical protein OXH79_03485, partial [Boseongicola sp.]|nr:hypothetical protein [Boseongicola sp.]